jgi:hypothetical protein
MRRWIPIVLIVLAVGWFLANNVGSSMALADATSRPTLALTRDGTRIPVRQPLAPVTEGEAQLTGGTGIQFGYSFIYSLPDGGIVTCNHRFRHLSCSDGWQVER